ncbi:MAG: hypothetical protein ACTSPB_00945 [Candidatus Thorarchaeota archaeon]
MNESDICNYCGKVVFTLPYIRKVDDIKIKLCNNCSDYLEDTNEIVPLPIPENWPKKMFTKMSRFIGRAEDRDESERMTRQEAEDLAEKMIKVLTPFVDFIEVCGSYRRGREDPGDLDIVVILNDDWTLPAIVGVLETSGLYTAVNWLGEKKTQIVVDGIKVDIKVSTPEGLGAALLYFTGPSGYNIGMRRAAKSRGMKLNEYGIWDRDTNTYLGGATEEEIYEIMDKTFKPPEKRAESEDYGVRPVWMSESFESEEDSKEYLVEIRNARGEVLWRSPCPNYDYLVKEINHMLRTHYYAIDVFTTGQSYYKYSGGRVIESPRKVHMATIKYGKAESGPLAAKLNESLIFRAESISVWDEDYDDDIGPDGWWYDAQCSKCGITFKNAAREDKIWIITVGGGWYRGKKGDGKVLLFCNECQEDAWDESDWDTVIDFSSENHYWSDADLFVDWLKDENLIFHELTNRTHKGPNYGAFRLWKYKHGILKPTRALWEESNFHIFEQTSRELMHLTAPYPFALKAEEGLRVMAAELSGFLVSLSKRAAKELDMDDWNEVVIIVDFTDQYADDQIMMIFPDGSEIELNLHNPKISFRYDEQDDTAELDWTVALKIVVVDDKYEF